MLLLAGACAAPLDDPARFADGGGDDVDAGEAGCADGVDVEVDIFATRCAGSICHSPGESAASGLDLVTPGVAERLVGTTATVECGEAPMLVAGDPDGSLLFTKLGPEPPCGDPMPLAQELLGADDLACVREWIEELP